MAQTGTLSLSESISRQRDFRVMAIVGLAHSMSHFCQLVLPMLSLRISAGMGYSYTQLGFVLSVFYITSCLVQTSSGFVVDKKGARPMLFIGLSLIGLGLLGYALSTSYWMLLVSAAIMGVGNGVFHPTDYTLLNKLVSLKRLSHAYSIHGISGNMGWALAPIYAVFIANIFDSWRIAMAASSALVALVLLVVFLNRQFLAETDVEHGGDIVPQKEKASSDSPVLAQPTESALAFLRLPAIWMCLAFFFFFALSNSAIQIYSSVAAQGLFGLSEWLGAFCVTAFMIASAGGMFLGGFLAADPTRCEKIVAAAFTCSVCMALLLVALPLPAVSIPVMFMLMGFSSGIAGPSRDLIVKRSTPPGASGRVFGVVYAGLDIGQSVAPMIYGRLMDHQNYAGLFIAMACVQGILVVGSLVAAYKNQRTVRTV